MPFEAKKSIIWRLLRRLIKMADSSHAVHSLGKMSSSPTKLTGRAFYENIGSPKMIVAPMVDRSEFVGTLSLNVL
jgi:hypothetical protein